MKITITTTTRPKTAVELLYDTWLDSILAYREADLAFHEASRAILFERTPTTGAAYSAAYMAEDAALAARQAAKATYLAAKAAEDAEDAEADDYAAYDDGESNGQCGPKL